MSVATIPSVLVPALAPSCRRERAEARPSVLFDYVSPAKKLGSARELDELFRFRHRVFCQELRFFDPAAYPDGRESDEYDHGAIHFAR